MFETTEPQYEIGTWVNSVAVGKAPAFTGLIVQRYGDSYVVRDPSRRRWYRRFEELEAA